PKVAFCLRDVDVGIWKDAISVSGREATDVIGMQKGDQNKVHFPRCVTCAPEATHQVPERSPTKPAAGAASDEDELLASVDQKTCIRCIQQVRICVRCLHDTIQ